VHLCEGRLAGVLDDLRQRCEVEPRSERLACPERVADERLQQHPLWSGGGDDRVGSVDLSDQCDHFALLASIENLFGLKLLGYAGFSGLLAFDTSTYDNFHG
jgi:hypothetical protein